MSTERLLAETSELMAAMAGELERKEDLLVRVLRTLKNKSSDLRAANKKIKALQTEKKRITQQANGFKGGIKTLKNLAQRRREALEDIAYLHENKKADLDKAEKVALHALDWKKHLD